jgi:hypothetical protein
MTSYRFPHLVADVHAMLLRLSGRVPDDVVAEARALLVAEDLGGLAALVTAAVVTQAIPVADRDVELLTEIGPRAQVVRYAEEPAPAWAFAPASPEVLSAHGSEVGRCLDLTDVRDRAVAEVDVRDAAVIDVAASTTGAVGLWRTWRFPPEGRPGRRVYLLEVAPDADPYLAALRAQVALASRGEADPQVEAYVSGSELPLYQRTARAWSALLWAPAPPRAFRRVRVYDAADEVAGPSFDAGHPRMTDAVARERVLGHLADGTVLRRSPALRDDVVDRTRRGVVPWRFVTDGEWIWSDAVAYYLRVHHLAPPADFLRHVNRAGHVPPSLDTVTAFRAMTALDR